ncbi:hypothetical protein PG985_002063 [Apiospora marii]|uniref:uncharacterized protein n=1 Tax=Apiospora marii TaxID=335849 RepID=UPI0031306D35
MTRNRRNGGSFNHHAPSNWPKAQPAPYPFGPKENGPNPFGPQQTDSYRPTGKPQKECRFWKKGSCNRGANCNFAHPPRTRENVQRWEIAEELQQLDQLGALYEPGQAHLPRQPLAGYTPSLLGATARPAQGGRVEGFCPVPPPDSDGDVHIE